jgi:uncharacterized protein (DUF697 family)
MSKLIVDTLQKNGNWDKQAIAFLVSFVISIILGITNTVLSYVLTITNNPTADNVFNSFMILTGAMSGVNIWNKIADSNIQRKEKEVSQTTTNTNTEHI